MDVIVRVNPREQIMDDAGAGMPRTHGALCRYQVMAVGTFLLLVTCADLRTRARWGWGRLATLVLDGVIPGLSFVVERRITREFAAAVAS